MVSADGRRAITRHKTRVSAGEDLIESYAAELWASVGLGITRQYGTSGWRVSAGGYVGVARLGAPDAPTVDIEIRPKVAADIFFSQTERSRAAHISAHNPKLRQQDRIQRRR